MKFWHTFLETFNTFEDIFRIISGKQSKWHNIDIYFVNKSFEKISQVESSQSGRNINMFFLDATPKTPIVILFDNENYPQG